MAIKVEKSVVIKKSPEELYRFWRNFENLPRFMNHLQSVRTIGDKRSHWVTEAPLGKRVEWDAEVTDEHENQCIAWQSLEGADVANTGSVRFRGLTEGGTEVTVTLEYSPPGGVIGAVVATIFGEAPDQQLSEDLHRLKQEVELGNVPMHHH